MWIVVKSAGITFLTAWLYYHSLWAVVVLSPVFVWSIRNLREECVQKKQKEFLIQFKEMIQSMASALNTGYSVENAMRETQKEMEILYPKETVLTRELAFMVRQLRIKIPMEQVLEEFAQKMEMEDVNNFAAVFTAAKRSGGDMIAIIQNTVDQIADKIEVKREIDTILAARKYEFKVMKAVPYGIIVYMMLSFPEFMGCLYGNIWGIGVMTVCLIMYGGACVLGAKLINIEV